jgi:hypothetical protein
MENLAVTVENVGKKSHFTSSIVIRVLLKKYLRLQWGQHMVQTWSDDVNIQQLEAWVNEQNDVISKVEIGNEARPTEVKNGEINKNYNLREVSNNNKTCPICRFVTTNIYSVMNFVELTTNQDGSLLKITRSASVAC